jgi:DNA-binding MarR family transcriptional regulator
MQKRCTVTMLAGSLRGHKGTIGRTMNRAEAQSIIAPLSVIVRWSRLRFYDRVAELAGVRIERSAIILLDTLARNGPLRTSDLAERLGLDRSTVSRQVARAVDGGLVKRTDDERDARATLLELTPLGLRTWKKLAAAWHKTAMSLVEGWSPDEQREIARLLGRLVERMEDDRPSQ